MLLNLPFNFSSPWLLWTCLSLAATATAITMWRRPAAPAWTKILCGVGLLLIALAAGGMSWQAPWRHEALVMVDLSPSTRTALYRNTTALRRRLEQLLGATPRRIMFFAGDNAQTGIEDDQGNLVDMPGQRTVFAPPAAETIVLFSDGQFKNPAWAPPVYAVLDPALEKPVDGGIDSLKLRGRQVIATVHNNGKPRTITFEGTDETAPTTLGTGQFLLTRTLAPGSSKASVHLEGQDAWPENDRASIMAAPEAGRRGWWIRGSAGRSAGADEAAWQTMAPGQLPADPSAWLEPSVVVLDNVAADELAGHVEQLYQYVSDLGGGLVILGGDHAFAAGGYTATPLEKISPLDCVPPLPTTHWMLLGDSSGSMSEAVGPGDPRTRWSIVAGAMTALLRTLPGSDLASIGCFANSLDWWSAGKNVAQTARLPLPPVDLAPHGPTNLRQALQRIADEAEPFMPKHLLVLSDADTTIDDPAGLAEALTGKKIHLHLLAIGEGSALPALEKIITLTGGKLVRQMDPGKWSSAAAELARGAMPRLLRNEQTEIRFRKPLDLAGHTQGPWNRTWVKPDAELLAEATIGKGKEPGEIDGPSVPMAARWRMGTGEVLAAAFAADTTQALAMADLIAQAPRDPRLRISWDSGSVPGVRLDAVDNAEHRYLNNLEVTLELRGPTGADEAPRVLSVPQTAPGHYELEFEAPGAPCWAFLRQAGQLIDKMAVAGRHAAEFDAIGNNHKTLRELAARSGGSVIDIRQTSPIDFRWPERQVELETLMAAGGALFIAVGLLVWRLG